MAAATAHTGAANRFFERGASWSKEDLRPVDSDFDTLLRQHGRRVARLTFAMCRYFGASEASAKSVARCSIYHDIGKLRISPYLLFFPGVLAEIELLAIRHASTPCWAALWQEKCSLERRANDRCWRTSVDTITSNGTAAAIRTACRLRNSVCSPGGCCRRRVRFADLSAS